MDPQPEIVDEVPFEQSDLGDVRDVPFSAGAHFFDHPSFGFGQFGGHDDDDDDDDEEEDDDEGAWIDEDDGMEGPDCRHQ